MQIYGISDLHLGPGSDKQHYSSNWKNHQAVIRANWDKRIDPNSLVLMPGDFSWHQTAEDLKYDYYWIDDRPGNIKILSSGNHDYTIWKDQKNITEYCKQFKTLYPIMSSAIRLKNPYNPEGPGIVIFSNRGTQSPGDKYFNTNSGKSAHKQEVEAKLYVRELARMAVAIQQAKKIQQENDYLICLCHYPPFDYGDKANFFSQMIEAAKTDLCLYGHLHQKAQWDKAFQGIYQHTEYRFVGTDFLEFEVTKIGELTEKGVTLNPIERDVYAQRMWKQHNSSFSTGTNYSSGYFSS